MFSKGHALGEQYPLQWECKSPNGTFRVEIFQQEERIQPVLKISGPGGNLISVVPEDNDFIGSYDLKTARWSPDSNVFAIASDESHSGRIWIFARKGSGFVQIPGPEIDRDNSRIRPVRWISGRRLILEFSGPHAGRGDYFYRGRFTVRIPREDPRCEVMYSYVVETNHPEE